MKKLLPAIAVAVLALVLFWVFSQRGIDRDHPAAHVPADTPFVLVNHGGIPERALAAWERQMEASAAGYGMQLDALRAMAADDAELQALMPLLDAIQAEFRGKPLRQALDDAGLGLDTPYALYGHGLAPVLRVQLQDRERFQALLDRLEAASPEAWTQATVDDQAYWQFGPGELPVQLVMAVVGDHWVASLAPATADPAVLRGLLGLQRPERSLLDAGTLAGLERELGYGPYLSGYIDSRLLATALLDHDGPLQAAVLGHLGQPQPAVAPVCREELLGLAEAWPRTSFGLTRADARVWESRAVLEARADIAESLATLAGPMAGLGATGDGTLVDVGIALQLGALPGVVNRHADAVARSPWQCEWFAGLNTLFASLREQAGNPAVAMAGPMAYSLLVGVDDIDLSAGAGQPDLSGIAILGTGNPGSLAAMARGFVPGLGGLTLQPDGEVHRLDMAEAGLEEPLHVAMGPEALGVAIGAHHASLSGAVTRVREDAPVLHMAASGRFYGLIADAAEVQMDSLAAMMEAQGEEIDDQTRAELEAMREEFTASQAQMREMMAAMEAVIQRVRIDLRLTARGIELEQRIDIAP